MSESEVEGNVFCSGFTIVKKSEVQEKCRDEKNDLKTKD